MCFRIDIECAAAQGSSTTTTTWDSRPRDRCDSCAEKDHDGSAPVKHGREELIKLVQLLIRWKAFNLDNLLTTWPTHYTFPISDNPQQGKKHSPIPRRRLDTVPSFCPSRATTSLLELSHCSITESFKGAVHLLHHHHVWWSRSIVPLRRHVEETRFVLTGIQVNIEEAFSEGIEEDDRRREEARPKRKASLHVRCSRCQLNCISMALLVP